MADTVVVLDANRAAAIADAVVPDEAALSSAALQKLLAWTSPSFPVGAFSYSHGLEWAIEDSTVTTAASLQAWLGDVLHHGAGRTDAILFCHAWWAGDDTSALRDLAELGAAFQPSKERHLEATAQGRAFLGTVAAVWPNERLAARIAALADVPVPYAIAMATAAQAHDIPLGAAVTAMLNGFVANIVSAGVRAVPIGQTDGQRIIAALGPVVVELSGAARSASLDDLGGAALSADIASMKHETQYTRLFRS